MRCNKLSKFLNTFDIIGNKLIGSIRCAIIGKFRQIRNQNHFLDRNGRLFLGCGSSLEICIMKLQDNQDFQKKKRKSKKKKGKKGRKGKKENKERIRRKRHKEERRKIGFKKKKK